MRSTLFPLAAALVASFFSVVAALKVTPNSPCYSFCMDSSSPNGVSSINGSEITCLDTDFQTEPPGQTYERCLSCLQDSSYASQGETDQGWFLYNLRYSFDYCVFGFPNATGIGSNPCRTSEACGPLASALESRLLTPDPMQPYGYCGPEGTDLAGDILDQCHQCVQATDKYSYLSNFIVALEAGCEQQPAAGVVLGLNDTVFSETTLGITLPSSADGVADGMSTVHIVIIALGALVVSLLAAGCIYMQVRKRKNRARRAARRDRATMSFRCQTKMPSSSSPRGDGFHRETREGGASSPSPSTIREKHFIDPAAALNSNPVHGFPSHTSRNLSSIDTSTVPWPPPVHASPQHRSSPDGRATPTSTTSLRSNAPLLHSPDYRPYVPSEYAGSTPPQRSAPTFTPGLALTTHGGTSQAWGGQHSGYGRQESAASESGLSPWDEQRGSGQGRELVGRKGFVGVGTPVMSTNLQTSFAPPPRR